MEDQKKIRVALVGDVQINREEPKSAFAHVLDSLKDSDFRFCQLEAVISDRGVVRPDVQNPHHRVSPKMIEGLVAAGFNAVTIAGNNNLDYGPEALFDTINRLKENGIEAIGTGKNIHEARQPHYFKIKDVTLAIVDTCSVLREGYAASETRAGISPLRISTFYEPLENIYEQPGTPSRTVTVPNREDLSAVCNLISGAKNQADYVIACFHWGVHFTYDLAIYQPDVAYAAIDAGADAVVGTHPHCLQAMDTYRDKPIFYSMSNFVFDQPERQASQSVKTGYLRFYGFSTESGAKGYPHPRHCRDTMIGHLTFSKRGVTAEITPCQIGEDATPRIVDKTTPEGKRIFDLIKDLNAEWHTDLEETPDGFVLSLRDKGIDTRALVRKRMMSYPWLYRLRVKEEQCVSE